MSEPSTGYVICFAHFMLLWPSRKKKPSKQPQKKRARILSRCSRHYQTGESLPQAAVEVLSTSRCLGVICFSSFDDGSRCALSGVIGYFNLVGGLKLNISLNFPCFWKKTSKILTNPTLPHKNNRKHSLNLEIWVLHFSLPHGLSSNFRSTALAYRPTPAPPWPKHTRKWGSKVSIPQYTPWTKVGWK